MRPEETLEQYEAKINMHDFDQLVPLISPNAIFWFNDGSFCGLKVSAHFHAPFLVDASAA
jgi:hypothetical protein